MLQCGLLSVAELSGSVITAPDKDWQRTVFLVPISLSTAWYQPVGCWVNQVRWRQRG